MFLIPFVWVKWGYTFHVLSKLLSFSSAGIGRFGWCRRARTGVVEASAAGCGVVDTGAIGDTGAGGVDTAGCDMIGTGAVGIFRLEMVG